MGGAERARRQELVDAGELEALHVCATHCPRFLVSCTRYPSHVCVPRMRSISWFQVFVFVSSPCAPVPSIKCLPSLQILVLLRLSFIPPPWTLLTPSPFRQPLSPCRYKHHWPLQTPLAVISTTCRYKHHLPLQNPSLLQNPLTVTKTIK